MTRRLLALALLASCSSATARSQPAPLRNMVPSLRTVLPASLAGHEPFVLEDNTGIVAIYVRDPKAPASATNRAIKVSILAPSPRLRGLGLVPGWFTPRSGDARNDVIDRDYGGRKAQLIRSRYECGATMLGKPVDPTQCSTDISFAIQLAEQRVLVVEQNPGTNDDEILEIVGTLDVSAIESAARRTIVSKDR